MTPWFVRVRSNLGELIPILLVIVCPSSLWALAFYQNEPEELYNQAVQAYNQNRLSDARTLFERIKGAHGDEANKYILKIKSYIDVMQVADSIMRRSPDELDVENLDFAIKEYQEAIAIKSDGPWKPKEKLEQAVALRAKVTQKTGDRDRALCQKAVDAVSARNYKLAEHLSCLLANDTPAYSCNGDEAVLMCEQMRDLAKIKPDTGSERKTGALDKAIAAYNKNDFKLAQSSFQRVSDAEKTTASEYLDKITHYQAAMEQAEKAAHENKYDEARAAYKDAVNIKPDGPGNPAGQAVLMDLQQGVDEFYSGSYTEADQHLSVYLKKNGDRADLASFYMGASKLARFFISGANDKALREQAMNDFRVAKKAGFHAQGQEVSPKILKAYEDVAF